MPSLPFHAGEGAGRLPMAVVSVLFLLSPPCFAADGPLHARIDRLIEEGNVAPVAGPADEATLVRRLYLDLTGGIPTAAQAREFLGDPSPDKLVRLIDQLLAGPDFIRHLSTTFDVWIMERRGETHVKTPEWRAYLAESLARDKPYDELVREILGADGSPEKNRAASRFYLDRLGEPDLLTRDVGRIFFGRDLQCAQCHDHPRITDYLQADYYGMHAFFSRTSFFQPDNKKPALLAEKAEGESESKSVFTDVPVRSGPRLLGGPEIGEPEMAPAGRYVVAPDPKDKKVRPLPKYSRREQLAKVLGDGSNAAFNANIANRLWAFMMGRGLVEPLDFHHSSNPASHPELLDLLAAEFAAMNYDTRSFLRELALTATYQRGSDLPPELEEQAFRLGPGLAALTGEAEERAAEANEAAGAREAAMEAWEDAKVEEAKVLPGLAKASKSREEAAAAAAKANGELEAAQTIFNGWKGVAGPLQEVLDRPGTGDGEVAGLRELIQRRVGEANAAMVKAEAGLAGKRKAADECANRLQAAEEELAKAAETVRPAREAVDRLSAEFADARARYETAKVRAKVAERRSGDAGKLMEFASAIHGAGRSREIADRNASLIGGAQAGLDALSEAVTRLERTVRQAAEREPANPELAEAVELVSSRGSEIRDAAEATRQRISSYRQEAEVARKETAASVEKALAVREALTERWSQNFSVGAFAPLTPEQLCLSMMRATGEWDRLREAGAAEFEKKSKDPAAADGKVAAGRDTYVEDYLTRVTQGAMGRFVSLFGGQAGLPQTDFYATADQALFLENDSLIRGWLKPAGENLAGRLSRLGEPEQIAGELYVSILSRFATPGETARVAGYLAARPDQRASAIQEMAWGLLSSTEFRFKH